MKHKQEIDIDGKTPTKAPALDRRKFILVGAGVTASVFAAGHSRLRFTPAADATPAPALAPSDHDALAGLANSSIVEPASVSSQGGRYAPPIAGLHPDDQVLDQVPDEALAAKRPPDVILSAAERVAFDSALARLRRLQQYVGFGNFNVIGWDQSLKLARRRGSVGAFTRAELDLIEQLFFADAKKLGFYGDKVVSKLTATIPERDIVKIPRSGHYLFKGESTRTYERIRRDLGDSVVLTSGIRSVVKQIYLFMNKAEKVDGNLSLASYSLAPPGHSYHAIGDFDVGKKGFGLKNFSAAFAQTDEFKRLIDLGYLDIRYPQQNPFGVRYEPWHIKVV
jgi:D-alanyl-D-alanine carboxypeptidase